MKGNERNHVWHTFGGGKRVCAAEKDVLSTRRGSPFKHHTDYRSAVPGHRCMGCTNLEVPGLNPRSDWAHFGPLWWGSMGSSFLNARGRMIKVYPEGKKRMLILTIIRLPCTTSNSTVYFP
eukprot:465997-Pelagomonas_calceolata.AAC.1